MSGPMLPYVVRQGDYLAKLAFVHGFDADEVWNDPKNDELRALRKDHHILAVGDILYIPAKARKESLPLAEGTSNLYVAKVPTVDVPLAFKDGDDKPLSDEPCEILGMASAGDGPADDKTDGEGKLTLKVPVTMREVSVHFVRRNVTYQVRVGDLDPEHETTGIQQRLQNLGLWRFDGEADPDPEATMRWALRRFQEKNGLEATGVLDDRTRQALTEGHGR